ncbi:helix-turn-helix domain-containing protein [Nocardioides marmotae]|uniref:HTH domain-containing protein n=1 Tax=Nocardioides marmotae TaxID=2663857 RepID=A0A6I3JF77_9ACTN|nr:helix-turn-helix transcriptional regulator [Nocardioides marmotae]MCR6033219.1 HTH domain-containing protein [Gordonia jinghuaiqii]MBC9732725.1 helix-turn-helix transcriptional regulator [Nocardioides marmotae]MTB83842.1 HTH domain-containing protein [Nocardioides marmotae]MTB96874.1 HTH domain-containing protein [Nocardioides marmotae]QKE02935.1 helix-turn-helix transcriptional regulator [Nocardioides marmotae]
MAGPRVPATLLEALGLGDDDDHFYERVRAQSGREVVSVAAALMRTPAELLRDLQPFMEHGIVRVEDDRVFVDSPTEAVVRVLAETAATAERAHARLTDLAAAVPLMTRRGRPLGGGPEGVRPLDGEVSGGGSPVELLRSLVERSTGEVRWLRPDPFRGPAEPAYAEVVAKAVAQGRRCRGIYPVRTLADARDGLAHRVAIGEEVRVLPQVPTRMLIVGSTHAVVPEPLGTADDPRSLVRERGLVQALTLWFDSMWQRALPVPELERADARPDLRRFLLQQLAAGAQDEQIARRLGVSLRTVRRRVADLLAELGADTRFQAGVEAARRGWL